MNRALPGAQDARSVTHDLLTRSVSRDPRRVVHRTPLPGTVAAEAGELQNSLAAAHGTARQQ
jgi:hypothetical protein